MARFKSVSGDVYVGEFAENEFHGSGQLTFKDGSFYNGAFERGKRHGEGQLIYDMQTAEMYRGEWREGKPEGSGSYIRKDGSLVEAQWSEGRLRMDIEGYFIRNGERKDIRTELSEEERLDLQSIVLT